MQQSKKRAKEIYSIVNNGEQSILMHSHLYMDDQHDRLNFCICKIVFN